jgi:uncharacterized protein YbbC (DUF1343 family)
MELNKKNYIYSIDRFYKIYKKILNKNESIGLISNQCSYSFYYKKYLFELIEIKKIFLLEHGFFSELQDQVPLKNTEFYYSYNLEWISLYGENFESLKPNLTHVEDLDTIIIDIQDIGSRYYTFLTSVYYLLETIVQNNLDLKIIILDRPNPLIKNYKKRKVEGTPLQKKYESFVGIEGILHQHGFTPAELIYFYWLKLVKNQKNPSKIYIIPFFKTMPIIKIYPNPKKTIIDNPYETLSFLNFFEIYPSPNMPSLKTAKIYTGQCLLEGTNLSEGRGTTKPFEIFGAPYISLNLQEKISALNEWNDFGVLLRKIRFIPTNSKYKFEICNGWQLHILKPNKYHSLLVTLVLLKTIKNNSSDFDWYRGVYEFKSEYLAIEYLVGDELLFSFLNENNLSFDDIHKYVKLKEKEWLKKYQKFYLYQ